jgi:hypothetical protein
VGLKVGPRTADLRSVESSVRQRVASEDRGDIIGSWLVKVTLTLAVAGVVLFDAISIGVASVSLQDTAQAAAREAVDATEDVRDPAVAYTAAHDHAVEQNPLNQVDPASVRIGEDGSVTVSVERTAPTLVVQRVGWIAGWAERDATRTAAPVR